MKYAVHMYPTVRVKVVKIEADSFAEAIEKAEAGVNLHDVLDNSRPMVKDVECIEWDEGETNFFLVDALADDGEIVDGKWMDGDGNPLIDGKTISERKGAAADDAVMFMDELLDSVETLSSIADAFGQRTLVDLMYLQNAILKGNYIDGYPQESAVLDIARKLPSGNRWSTFIKMEDVEKQEVIIA